MLNVQHIFYTETCQILVEGLIKKYRFTEFSFIVTEKCEVFNSSLLRNTPKIGIKLRYTVIQIILFKNTRLVPLLC